MRSRLLPGSGFLPLTAFDRRATAVHRPVETDPTKSMQETDYATQPANPCVILSTGRLRPMNTMRLVRFSPSFHGR